MELGIVKLTDTAKIPDKAYKGDAGFDLYADEDVVIRPGETKKISTGISYVLSEGYFLKIFDRSSVGSKGLLVNAGVLDAMYRGPVIVCMTNLRQGGDEDTFIINRGDKIAQMVVLPVPEVSIKLLNEVNTTNRGDRGFGSSDSIVKFVNPCYSD